MTGQRWLLKDTAERVTRLNRMLIGWANYFCSGAGKPSLPSKSNNTLGFGFASGCVQGTSWLGGAGHARFAARYLHHTLGLVDSSRGHVICRGRKRESLSESRMRQIRTSGSIVTSGDSNAAMVGLVRHRQTKRPATDARPPARQSRKFPGL